MERKAIAIQGISTGSNYDDGACISMLNMRHEQGVLKPVESFPVDFTLKHVYDLLYWHKNNDYAHLIGVRNNGIYWIQHPGEESETEGTSLLTVTSTVSLSNMGNIINVLDGDVLKYIFWQESSYYVIDMDFDNIPTENISPLLRNVFTPHMYQIVLGHTWTSYDLITHNVELNPNYFYITITDNKLYISFQYEIYYNITIDFRIYESDNMIFYDYSFELIPSDENSWGTSLIHVEDLSYTATTSTDYRIVKNFSQPNSGIEVNDQGVPTIGGGYWIGNLTHYYLYEDGNYPPSPIINILAYDGWQNIEHNDEETQVYTITLVGYIDDYITGILHLTVDGAAQSHTFQMDRINYVNTAQIVIAQNSDTARSVSFDNPIDNNAFHVEILEPISEDFKITYTITDTVYENEFTHEFTVLAGSTVSETYTVKCSNIFTSVSTLDVSEEILGPVKVDFKVDGYTNDSVRKTLNFYSDVDVTVGSPYDDKQKLASGLFLKAKSYDDSEGRLTGFILACTALELYDGSFILQSNPVLLGQAFDEKTRYTSENITGHDYIENPALYYSPGAVSWDIVTSNANNFYEKITNEIITGTSGSDDVLTTYFPNAFCSSYFLKINGGSTVKRMVCRKSSNALKIKISNPISEQYRTLIKSVSIFISPQVFSQDYKTIEYKGYFDYNGVSANRSENYFAKPKSNADILKELVANQKFYKIKEIAFDDIIAGSWIDLTEDLKGKLGDNLHAQKELTTASFSNIKSRNQMTYNSMLHAWDIKNIASRGWSFNYFEQKETGIGQFPAQYSPIYNYAEAKWIRVKIKTEFGITEVVRGFDNLSSGIITPVSGVVDFIPILSYPDARATEMTIYHKFGTNVHIGMNVYGQTYKLTASSTGDFAYYISPDLKPISWAGMDTNIIPFPNEINRELSYQNKLKVSNTNNPFVFPDGQTYQIGDGTILNVASQSIRTSDGQFGQYPLVCFCTDGIFTLQVGDGTVAYSKVGTPQNYERPISKVICVTPYGIAFISNRGLCMVVGQDIQYLSESMFEKFRSITLELPEQIENLFTLDLGSFNDYLKDCTAMLYNPKEQEIIMINPDKTYNYVYNMSTKQFYRNTEAITNEINNSLAITNEINNSLPDMQVWTGATVKKVTIVEAGSREISFVTRPIKMQTPDMKRFERVILRAYLSGINGTPAIACIWGSIDDRNFKLLRGMVLTNGTTRKDIDFGMFGKTTYRSYIIGLSMTVATDSEVEAIEMQVEKEFLDTKMR